MEDKSQTRTGAYPWPFRFSVGFFRISMKLLLILLFLAGGVLVGGFLKFASTVTQPADTEIVENSDSIVVLTGGTERIASGLELLAQNKGKRLLISGTNPTTTATIIKGNHPKHAKLFECCVDVESVALDTIGNASETRSWLNNNGYESLILVTSNYHMPRGLREFRKAMPSVKIRPFAVFYRGLNDEEWWKDADILRLMVEEYLKYVGSITMDYVEADTLSALRASMWGV